MRNFGKFEVFFGKLEKNPISSWKFGIFFSNSHYSGGHFFEIFFLSETSHTWSLGQINFPNFGTFEIFLRKLEKNSQNFRKIGIFFFKIPLLRRSFFRDFFFVWNFAHLIFRTNKFSEFWNIWDFFKKIRKNSQNFRKIGIFFWKKSFSDFAENWLRCKSE